MIRGYNVMHGYLDEPDETAATIDGDGWLHTGDIGVMDERGYLRITDRTKDMFIVGGFNAYPAEIENLLLRNESDRPGGGGRRARRPDGRGRHGVRRAAAGRAAPRPTELIAWCRAEMANYKVPRIVEFVDELPLNATGKVLKYELRDRGAKLVNR